MNTTKQQPTYQLFQNIMRSKIQLVNPPKMTKFTSICAVSQFLLLFCSSNGLWCWANGPIRVDLGVTWLAKWRGMDHSARGLCLHRREGLSYCYVMQNTNLICTFHALLSEQKNTFRVILETILLFLLVQYDGIYFIVINHDNFKFILDIQMTTFLKEWDMTITDKLGKDTFEVMACLTVKRTQITEIFPYFLHATRRKNNSSTITFWIIRSFGRRK